MININFRNPETLYNHYDKHVVKQKEPFNSIDNVKEDGQISQDKYLSLANDNIEFCDYFYPANYKKHNGLGQLRINQKVNSLSITTTDAKEIKSFYIPNNSHIIEFFMCNYMLCKNNCFFKPENILYIKNTRSKKKENFWNAYVEDVYQCADMEAPSTIKNLNDRILFVFYKKFKSSLPDDIYSYGSKLLCTLMYLYFSNKKLTYLFKEKIKGLILEYEKRVEKNEAYLKSVNYEECIETSTDLLFIIFEYTYNRIITHIGNSLLIDKKPVNIIHSNLNIVKKYYSEYETGLLNLFNL